LCAQEVEIFECLGDSSRLWRVSGVSAGTRSFRLEDGIAANTFIVATAAWHREAFGDHQGRGAMEIAVVRETELKGRRN